MTGLEYKNEYMVVLSFVPTESGPKISHAKEFVDASVSKGFFAKERERQAQMRAK